MSLNYTNLQSTVLAYAVRPELTTEVLQFIRQCEAMIRRKVRAYEVRTTIGESARISAGVYNLSGQVQYIRAIFASAADGSTYPLENVGLQGIRMVPVNADVMYYAVSGQTVEFRGVPGSGISFEVIFLGWPDPLDVTASNNLLTNHEDIYIYGTLFHLYNYTQDLELAQSALSIFQDAANRVNEFNAHLSGGGSQLPAYNFGHVRIGKGY